VAAIKKIPRCFMCGGELKGKVPADTKVICFFCANPPPEDPEEDGYNFKDKK